MRKILFSTLLTLGVFLGATATQAQAWTQGVTDGAVQLNWGFRGGTCNIRYTETSENFYKYTTSTGCDNGFIVIDQLVPGQSYRFQISQDWNSWSKPVVVRAQAVQGVTAQMQPVMTANVNGNGAVQVVWGYRGGNCVIRYTEANQQTYKYWTQTGCDDGQIVISQLMPGRSYRFQVVQDWTNFSRPVVRRAQDMNAVTTAAVATTTPVAQTMNVASNVWTAAMSATNNDPFNGAARVSWAYRGGTCNVMYSEAGMNNYRFATSAGCDETGVTINHLVVGQRYNFIVAQDNTSFWTRPVSAVAR